MEGGEEGGGVKTLLNISIFKLSKPRYPRLRGPCCASSRFPDLFKLYGKRSGFCVERKLLYSHQNKRTCTFILFAATQNPDPTRVLFSGKERAWERGSRSRTRSELKQLCRGPNTVVSVLKYTYMEKSKRKNTNSEVRWITNT